MRRKPRYINAGRKAQVERFKDAQQRLDTEDSERAKRGFGKMQCTAAEWEEGLAALKLSRSQRLSLMEGRVKR